MYPSTGPELKYVKTFNVLLYYCFHSCTDFAHQFENLLKNRNFRSVLYVGKEKRGETGQRQIVRNIGFLLVQGDVRICECFWYWGTL